MSEKEKEVPGNLNISPDELRNLVQAGVEREKLSILIEDFKSNKIDQTKKLILLDKKMEDIFTLIRNFPTQINSCRDDIEKDFHQTLEKHYATESDLELLDIKLSNQINSVSNRFKWTTGVIVSVVGMIQFFTTMWYLGLQINKLAGTGG